MGDPEPQEHAQANHHTRLARAGESTVVKRLVLVIALLLPLTGSWAADIPFEFSDPAQEERYKGLLEELRCLVCQNQSLADSNADLAQDLRQEVYRMVLAGDSDERIIDFLVARYGDFVLYRPPIKPRTYLLWFGPVALLLLGILIVSRFIRRRAVQTDATLSEQEKHRITELLDADTTKEKTP
jgi:cytochrome c-type biogenesis protein CcmH